MWTLYIIIYGCVTYNNLFVVPYINKYSHHERKDVHFLVYIRRSITLA